MSKSIKNQRNKQTKKNKSKKRGHLKYRKVSRSKIGGNGDTLTIMTFNVEVFLELYDYDKHTNTVSAIDEKMDAFGSLFDGIDVACLQETAIPTIRMPETVFVSTGKRKSTEPFSSPVPPSLQEVSSCISHELTWSKSTALYGEKSHLANSIYVSSRFNDSITSPIISNTQISSFGDQRCYASTTISFKGIPITIASVHIIGGRFDDQNAIQSDDNINEKQRQIAAVIDSGADIICGDFNTKIRHDADSDKYFENIFTHSEIDPALKAECKARWDRWIYMDIYHPMFTDAGYKSVYYLEDGTIIDTIIDTSAFGGIVDMIYYKSEKLRLIGAPEIVGKNIVMNGPESYFKHKPILSDHYPVKAIFVPV